jgi:hypothetical protein
MLYSLTTSTHGGRYEYETQEPPNWVEETACERACTILEDDPTRGGQHGG